MTGAREEDLRGAGAEELTSQLLTRASRNTRLALAKHLDADAARELNVADARAALDALKPHLPAALAIAMASSRDGEERVTSRAAARLAGIPYTTWLRFIREGRLPVPIEWHGRCPKFRRSDLARLGARDADDPIARAVADALREALAVVDKPALMSARATARALRWPWRRLSAAVDAGRAPLPIVRMGRLIKFRSSDVAAYLAAKET